jgi:[acyl-carrier-protein] S-malonyltransferase
MSAGLDLSWTADHALQGLIEGGPEDVLTQTLNAQKAVYAVTAALWEKSGLNDPLMVMGHSLGEYMALTASGALSRKDCYALVCERAAAMDEAMPKGQGAMAAVLGMTGEEIAEALKGVEGVWVANFNMKGQAVISGDAPSVEQAAAVLKGSGARRIVPLNVAVASHCPRMEPARKKLKEYLSGVALSSPGVRMVFNATASEESDPEKIKELLADQLVKPVLWEKSVRYAFSRGVDTFIEIGPRSVLGPMVRKIVPEANVEVITAHEH